MAYIINTCILNKKCSECEHSRSDPERFGEHSCFLNEDLKGKERADYLLKLLEHFKKNSLQRFKIML